jgi:uncharacterized protein
VRVGKDGKWAVASRDFFRAMGCEHCLRLSMAVQAGLPSVLAKVEPYLEDLSTKLPIVQGNQREAIVFDQLRASLPEGDFVLMESRLPEDTIAVLKSGVPVVAQGFLKSEIHGYEWTGFADLLVLEGYVIRQDEDGCIAAVQVGDLPEVPRYVPWDVKNASSGDSKYQLQLAGYHHALAQLGLDSQHDMGIVLAVQKGIVDYSVAESLLLYEEAIRALVAVLDQVTPQAITEDFVASWSCDRTSVCRSVYCEYPQLCKAEFVAKQTLDLLNDIRTPQKEKFNEAGIFTVPQLAALDAAPDIEGLKPQYSERYWNLARVFALQAAGTKALVSKVAGHPDVPAPSAGDLYFDIEWFSPVDMLGDLVFMFGFVDSKEEFTVLLADDKAQERAAFDSFLDLALANLHAHPQMHIYHYSPPEVTYLRKLSAQYGGHRQADVEQVVEHMLDLCAIAKASFLPGSNSYSIKKLEQYYDADSKLNRTELVAGGDDAMYQYELYRQAVAQGDAEEAQTIMAMISAYNRDDCLSTKLLADWLRSLNFASAGQLITV